MKNKPNTITWICDQCKTTYPPHPASVLRNRPKRFCSTRCRDRYLIDQSPVDRQGILEDVKTMTLKEVASKHGFTSHERIRQILKSMGVDYMKDIYPLKPPEKRRGGRLKQPIAN